MHTRLLLTVLLIGFPWPRANGSETGRSGPSSNETTQYQQDARECSALAEGKSRVVNEDKAEWGILRKYRVRRDRNKGFIIDLNLELVGDAGGKVFARAKSCVQKYRGFVRDPDGNTFDLNIEHGENAPPIPKSKVKIENVVKSHSDSWSKDINCEDMIHEMFHLTGLVDAYVTEENPCRQIEKVSNIMFRQAVALESYFTSLICYDRSLRNPPSLEIRNTDKMPQECPPGSRIIRQKAGETEESARKYIAESGPGTIAYLGRTPVHTNLSKQQSDMLTMPHCSTLPYIKVAKIAYQKSCR